MSTKKSKETKEKKVKKASDLNIINIMEERLQQLKVEKEEMEKLYGVSEEKFKTIGKVKKDVTPSLQNYELAKLKEINRLDGLPSLEVQPKKEEKRIYKTPDALVDQLKYEPNINDLIDKNEFDAKFYTLDSLKCPPANSKIDDRLFSSFYEYNRDRLIDKFIN